MNVRSIGVVFASVISAGVLNSAEYTQADRVLQVTVAEGTTNVIDSTYVEKLNNRDFDKLVKKGVGGLDIDVSLEGYMGAIDVEEGSLIYRTSTSLGSLAEGNGAVTVKDGATLCAWCTTVNGLTLYGKTFTSHTKRPI